MEGFLSKCAVLRLIIEPSHMLFAGVYACTFQPRYFTGCGREGVKTCLLPVPYLVGKWCGHHPQWPAPRRCCYLPAQSLAGVVHCSMKPAWRPNPNKSHHYEYVFPHTHVFQQGVQILSFKGELKRRTTTDYINRNGLNNRHATIFHSISGPGC